MIEELKEKVELLASRLDALSRDVALVLKDYNRRSARASGTLPQKFKRRLLARLRNRPFMTYEQIKEECGVSESAMYRYLKRFEIEKPVKISIVQLPRSGNKIVCLKEKEATILEHPKVLSMGNTDSYDKIKEIALAAATRTQFTVLEDVYKASPLARARTNMYLKRYLREEGCPIVSLKIPRYNRKAICLKKNKDVVIASNEFQNYDYNDTLLLRVHKDLYDFLDTEGEKTFVEIIEHVKHYISEYQLRHAMDGFIWLGKKRQVSTNGLLYYNLETEKKKTEEFKKKMLIAQQKKPEKKHIDIPDSVLGFFTESDPVALRTRLYKILEQCIDDGAFHLQGWNKNKHKQTIATADFETFCRQLFIHQVDICTLLKIKGKFKRVSSFKIKFIKDGGKV